MAGGFLLAGGELPREKFAEATVAHGIFLQVGGVVAEFLGTESSDTAATTLKGLGGKSLGVVVGEHKTIGIFYDASAAAVVGK